MPHQWTRNSEIPVRQDVATLTLGIPLEVFLMNGAEFNDDRGPAGSCDPFGYEMPAESAKPSSIRIAGIVSRIDLESDRLFLAPSWDDKTQMPVPQYCSAPFYVKFDAISAYKTI